jgi:hypothetical protein
MRSQLHRSSHSARRPEYARTTVIAHSVPLWCQSHTTAWQALMRSRLMADEAMQVLRRLIPTPRELTPLHFTCRSEVDMPIHWRCSRNLQGT